LLTYRSQVSSATTGCCHNTFSSRRKNKSHIGKKILIFHHNETSRTPQYPAYLVMMASRPRIPYRPANVLPPGIPPLNLFRLWAHAPTALPHIISLGTALFRDTSVPARLRELGCLLNAKRLKCDYQWIQHVPIAKQNSVTEAQIVALEAGDLLGDVWSAEEKALLAFLDQVIKDPQVEEDVFVNARKHFSDRKIPGQASVFFRGIS
jgi:alkylhydroperoxidase family enzyme